jgi:hypothetical protein
MQPPSQTATVQQASFVTQPYIQQNSFTPPAFAQQQGGLAQAPSQYNLNPQHPPFGQDTQPLASQRDDLGIPAYLRRKNNPSK